MKTLRSFLLATWVISGLHCAAPSVPPEAVTNDNRIPAGHYANGVLHLTLELRTVTWRPEGADGATLPIQVLAEAGKPALVPGPLIRVPAGSEIQLLVRNPLSDSTLVLHGFAERPGTPADSLVLGPQSQRELRFRAGTPGTYYYWGTTTHRGLGEREWFDSQLSGGFIVDSAGTVPEDRVFVLGDWLNFPEKINPADPDTGEVMTINGLAWPHTEHITVPVGDSLKWRLINPTGDAHPMHLHGVFYEVESEGDINQDTLYPVGQRPFVVTHLLVPGATMAMRWAPARPGNWIFHCHFAFHVSPGVSFDRRTDMPGHHRMAGLVLGITATGGQVAPDPPVSRSLRLLVQQRDHLIRGGPGYGYVLQNGPPPAADSVRIPGTPLLLTQGEPVAITVVNHLPMASAVHWHGMELESYNDGVPDLSGVQARRFHAIAPGDSFTARFTPRRSGTFIYHTHFDELDQESRGLYGAMLILPPGAHYDPATDHLVIAGGNGPATFPDTIPGVVNGSGTPAPLVLAAGRPNRLRLISIDPDHRLVFTLLRDTMVTRWRALAKDGAELSPALATERQAVLLTGPGETADFEITPTGPGRLSLRIAAPFADIPWSISLPLLTR